LPRTTRCSPTCTNSGSTSEIVHDGGAAIDAFDASVDVVLLDRRMSTRSGDDVLDHIRDGSPTCPVGTVTTTDPDLDLVELGVDAFYPNQRAART
jgi:CheY-like chemotaxis protein